MKAVIRSGLCLAAVLCCSVSIAADKKKKDDDNSPGLTGFDIQFINDSNPAKAEFERDIEATNAVKGRLTGNLWSKELIKEEFVSSGLSINGSASYEHNLDLEGLGESRYRASIDWFRENRTSEIAPFFRASFGLGYLDSETKIRDSSIVDLSGSINIQPTAFSDTTLGFSLEVREAETEVFDTTKTQFFLTANFSPFSRFVIRAGLRYVIGHEVSTATPTLNVVNNAQAIEPDNAFGGFEANRFAYLIDANSAIGELGLGYEVSDAIEANLLYRYVSTSAEGDIGYDRNMIELTFSYSL